MDKKTVQSRIVAVVLGILFFAAAFMAGFFVREISLPRSVSTYKWALKKIEDNYCGDYNESDYIYLPNSGYSSEEMALKALASTLDNYSEYYTAKEYKALVSDNAGNKSGVGVSTNFVDSKGAIVITVVGNSPAFRAGIRAGDVITGGAVDGAETRFTSNKVFTDFIADRQTGEKFTLITEDGEFNLSKEEYTASYATMYTSAMEYGFQSEGEALNLYGKLSDEMSFLPEYAAYIRMTQFYGGLGQEFAALVNTVNSDPSKDTLILDLRNNGGGYVSAMQSVAGCFEKSSGKVAMTSRYKNGKEIKYPASKPEEKYRLKDETKVYVLCNLNTASASEALIGVLVSYGILDYQNIFVSQLSDGYLEWAGLSGEEGAAKSYGKGIMQTTYTRFETGEALKLTNAKIYWPNGVCIHGRGVTVADGCRAIPAEWTATKGDTELRTAVNTIIADREN